MTTTSKEETVQRIAELIKSSKVTTVARYDGMDVKAMQELRKISEGFKIVVFKNRLFKIALGKNESFLIGALVYAFGDEVPRSMKHMELVGGFSEGKTLSKEEVTFLANLPTKQELIAEIVGMLDKLPQIIGGV